ncbi:VOC family protein [Streptomyces sp. NRRL S-646]|uniref:VOC family protein n=1 Tax=Streptomyces sp. NRRL S-646 TaxID=1463917 RepID=UPI0004C511A6|nr:VOC family protein [Streptomyces sp. NRRL S-646]
MDLKLNSCFIAVDDHDKAIAFYCDVLGLEIRNDVKYEGMRWTTVGSPLQPDVSIVLEPPAANPDLSPADRDAMEQLLAKGVLRGVNFTTEDCDALFARVQESGAEVIQEPTDMPYGVRDCAFRDPAGNMLRFMERKG